MEKLKEVIRKNIGSARCGIFFTRNLVGDRMTVIYQDDKYTVEICYGWEYFEVLGCNEKEQAELEKFYKQLRKFQGKQFV